MTLFTIYISLIILVLYPYVIYPLCLLFLSKIRPAKISKSYLFQPFVSVVVAVKNGQAYVDRRVQNLLNLDYRQDNYEIIFVSDGSSDATNKLLLEYEQNYPGKIKFFSYEKSCGKPYALNLGISHALGEVILFADCRQIFDKNVISELVANFFDSRIGCVSGELVFCDDVESTIRAEMGAYWKYEKWLRKLESKTGSVVGATGAIYAIRKELYVNLPQETLLDDVLTPMNIVNKGFRVVFEPLAVAYDSFSKDLCQEKKRKLRTLTGNWQLLRIEENLIFPWSNLLWMRFFSHKILRLVVPFVLPLLLVLSFCFGYFILNLFGFFQILFYLFSAIGLCSHKLRNIKIVNISYFFVEMNFTAAKSLFLFLLNDDDNLWK